MKIARLTVFAFAAAMTLASHANSAPKLSAVAQMDRSYDHFIISYRQGSRENSDQQAVLQNILAALGRAGLDRSMPNQTGTAVTSDYVRKLSTGGNLIRLSRPLSPTEANIFMQRIAEDPAVEYVEPDRVRRLDVSPQAQVSSHRAAMTASTAGSLESQPWFLVDPRGGIRGDRAWKLPGANGDGVVVAVLDTGITHHPELGRTLEGYSFYVSFDDFQQSDVFKQLEARNASVTEFSKAFDTYKIAHRSRGAWDPGTWCPSVIDPSDTNAATPSNWHGTAVAGLVAGKNAPDEGVSGVAPAATVPPVRVIGKCGDSTSSDTADAIMWAAGGKIDGIPANPHPAQVINLSLTAGMEDGLDEKTCSPRSTISKAVAWALKHGSVVIAAAGNDGKDTQSNVLDSEFAAPANCPGVIAVAATNIMGARASYSTYGKGITLAAPGGDQNKLIRVPTNQGILGPGQPGYTDVLGTSASAPIVSGVVALMISARQKAGLAPLSPADITHILTRTARPSPSAANTRQSIGAGIVDAEQAVREALKAKA
jgi:serine protease